MFAHYATTSLIAGSEYYAMCMKAHIVDADVILGDHAINDINKFYGLVRPEHHAAVQEAYARQVRAHSPSTLYVYTAFYTQFGCRSGEDIPSLPAVYDWYNVTAISLRNAMFGNADCQCMATNSCKPFHQSELITTHHPHPSALAHRWLANLLTYVFDKVMSKLRNQDPDSYTHFAYPLPPPMPAYRESWLSNRTFDCRTTLLPHVGPTLSPEGCSLFMPSCGVWRYIQIHPGQHNAEDPGQLVTQAHNIRIDKKMVWYVEDLPNTSGTSASFRVSVRYGIIAVVFLSDASNSATATCWLDNNPQRNVTVPTHIGWRTTVVRLIFTDAEPGEHILTIQKGKQGSLSIVAVIGDE
jgi:hypothetical protein